MRLAAMAYRPRSAKTAYGSGIRNIRLPYIYDIPNAHQPAPHVAGGRYGSNHPHLIVRFHRVSHITLAYVYTHIYGRVSFIRGIGTLAKLKNASEGHKEGHKNMLWGEF